MGPVGAPGRLLDTARTLADEGLVAAYQRLARADDCKLDGLGLALAAKRLYSCLPQPAEQTALILDDLVAFWLDCKVTFRLHLVPWSAPTYRRCLDQLHAWADALACAPDDLERCMFQVADSTPIRSPVPRQSDQPFHGFPITPR